jgi:rhodanese-related sulfurtransferase
MTQFFEFAANHPFLVSAAVALFAIIVWYEVKRATRGYQDLEPAAATRLMNHDDALMVDVRSAADFDKGHILNAVNVPEAELGDRLGELTKRAGRPVIVYCGNGLASGRTASRLVGAGVKPVYNLKGGLAAWEGAALPVVRGRKAGKK